jgi:hypothetical protein
MLPNEKFALDCRQRYAESGDLVDRDNGVFAHCPIPECEGGTEGLYLTFEDHQHQGLLQSVDFDRICFFPGHVKQWLLTCCEFPEGYFDLWDIYDFYVSSINVRLHEVKNKDGKSIHAVCMGKKAHEKKDENGKSLLSVRQHRIKDSTGKSLNAVRNGQKAGLVHMKPVEVIRISDGHKFTFDSLLSASASLGLNIGNLSSVCSGRRKRVKGFTATYINQD